MTRIFAVQIQDMDMGDQMNFDTDLPQPPQDNNQVTPTYSFLFVFPLSVVTHRVMIDIEGPQS
jgi:hypothetical protein